MNPARRGYPLGALFVLVTASAVLIAGFAPMVKSLGRDGSEIIAFLATLGGGALSGLLVGLIVGLLQFRMALGAGMGALAGLLIGAAGGAIAFLPANELGAAAAAITAGSALIIGVALIMRRTEE